MVIILSFIFNLIYTNDFNMLWFEMQKDYKQLQEKLAPLSHLEKDYCHKNWQTHKQEIRNLIASKPNRHFLFNRTITNTMVRRTNGIAQQWELSFLRQCTNLNTETILKKFKDKNFGLLPIDIKPLNCSINTLGHLYYTAKILEKLKTYKPKTIVEFEIC